MQTETIFIVMDKDIAYEFIFPYVLWASLTIFLLLSCGSEAEILLRSYKKCFSPNNI